MAMALALVLPLVLQCASTICMERHFFKLALAMSQKCIAVVCTARPSYAKLQPVIAALIACNTRPMLYFTSGAVLTRFGRVVDQARTDFPDCPLREIYSELDGQTLVTSAKSAGGLLMALADAFAQDRPDIVLVNHDRREVLAVAQAAAYQNIPVAHIGGGERSGNIDDRVRDAVTQFSTYHFAATSAATLRVCGLRMGHHERHAHIYCVGCPSVDVARQSLDDLPVTLTEMGGAGAALDLNCPFLLVVQHSETEYPDAAFDQMMTTLNVVRATKYPAVVLWPGTDAGEEDTAKAIRVSTTQNPSYPMHTKRTLPPRRFLRLLRQAICIVGNSSVGIREASFLGVPVVNIGERQRDRERGDNVLDVPHQFDAITHAIMTQTTHGPWPSSVLYGDGYASQKIASILTP